MAVVPLLATAVLLGGSVAVGRGGSARAARATATWIVAAVAGAVAVAAPLAEAGLGAAPDSAAGGLSLSAAGMGRWMPLVTCLAGLAATALAPAASHPPRTLARVLLVLAGGTASTVVDDPRAVLACWALSAFFVWRELLDRSGQGGAVGSLAARGPARVFALHQAAGVGVCAMGLLWPVGPGPGVPALLVMLGVAVRQCVAPLHLWQEALARSAPAGILVAFTAGPAGLLLLTETAPRLPGGWDVVVIAASAATALLAACLGLVARDVRSALGRVGLVLTGIVTCGILAGTGPAATGAVAGAVLAWQVGVLATGGAMMTAAATEARRGPMTLTGPGNCFARTPKLAVAFLLFGLTAVGYPATAGFVWEEILLDGLGGWSMPLASVLALAVAGSGATVMKWYFAGYTGRRDHVGEHDLTTREFRVVTVLLALLLLTEIHPDVLLGYDNVLLTRH